LTRLSKYRRQRQLRDADRGSRRLFKVEDDEYRQPAPGEFQLARQGKFHGTMAATTPDGRESPDQLIRAVCGDFVVDLSMLGAQRIALAVAGSRCPSVVTVCQSRFPAARSSGVAGSDQRSGSGCACAGRGFFRPDPELERAVRVNGEVGRRLHRCWHGGEERPSTG